MELLLAREWKSGQGRNLMCEVRSPLEIIRTLSTELEFVVPLGSLEQMSEGQPSDGMPLSKSLTVSSILRFIY